jgi:hypothetical protein
LLRRNINPAFDKTKLRAITPESVRTWHRQVTARARAHQAAKSYRLLRAIMSTAASDGLSSRQDRLFRPGLLRRRDVDGGFFPCAKAPDTLGKAS